MLDVVLKIKHLQIFLLFCFGFAGSGLEDDSGNRGRSRWMCEAGRGR